MDVDAFLRSAALDMLFSNLDTYTGSARNYYLPQHGHGHVAVDQVGRQRGVWVLHQRRRNMETLAIDYSDSRPLLENMLGHPDLYARYIEHVCDLVDHVFNEAHMHAQIDATAELIAPFVYADSHKMYSNDDFDTNLSANLVSGGGPAAVGRAAPFKLKSFVTNRASYVLTRWRPHVFGRPRCVWPRRLSQPRQTYPRSLTYLRCRRSPDQLVGQVLRADRIGAAGVVRAGDLAAGTPRGGP